MISTSRLLGLALLFGIGVAPRAAAQSPLPRFEPVPCFESIASWATPLGADCGWLVAPALRDRPDAGTVRLPVVRVRATAPDGSPPLVYLHGGPGGQGVVRTSARGIFAWPIVGKRDVVVYDQRGAGLSEPELCPEVAAEIDRRREREPQESQERWDRNARDCVAAMRAQGIDPLAYTTQNNVLDLIDLRRSLGYDRWDVYGVSYGGTLAQLAMREDGPAVRAAVLAYSSVAGPAMQAEAALSYQRSLEHLFEACSEAPSCRAAFPTLAEDFFALFHDLEDDPIDVRVERTSGPTTIRLDGKRFLREMRCQLTSPRTLTRIPLLIRELRSAAPERARQVLAASCAAVSAFDPTVELVLCHAIHGDAYRRAAEEVRRQVRDEFRWMVGENPACDLWQRSFADRSMHEPVMSDTPTLLITGEFDERSPTSLSRRIAASLSRSWLYEIPGESHGGVVTGCHADILFQFLADPTREPDARCLAEMPTLTFETEQLMLPTLSLRIVGGAGASNLWAGLWQAEIPNAPQPVTFELSVGGTSLTGTLHPQERPVFDGTVEGNRLRFRVRSPDGLRTITFSGELEGDEISFTRDIEVPDGAPAGGRWIFGVDGVKTFVARRGG